MANYPSGSGKVLAAGSVCHVPYPRGSPVLGTQGAASPTTALLFEVFCTKHRLCCRLLPSNLCPGDLQHH